ncbi:peptide deformylase [bacterium]|nr:peptide deformylase [bacterium]
MAVVPILTVPNPLLEQKCKKVEKVDEETKQLVQNLLDTLRDAKDPEGAGLAAPQVGVLKRVCIVRKFLPNPDPNSTRPYTTQEQVLINPKIISADKETTLDYEGCLSIPNTYGKVLRAKKLKIKALDELGNKIRIKANDEYARIIQHEMDHLDGILFTTKLVGETLTEKELDKLYEK